jgi:ribonuclease HI
MVRWIAELIRQGNVYLAELWGFYEGLKYVRRLKFHYAELHIDSMIVVRTIIWEFERVFFSGEDSSANCFGLKVVVKYSYREAN